MSYVESITAGLSAKDAVVGGDRSGTSYGPATYSDGVLSPLTVGALVVDGVTCALGDRVLVKNETAQANNGIYVVQATGSGSEPWSLIHSPDMDTAAEVGGAYTFAQDRTANEGFGFIVFGPGPFTLGTTAINWVQFTSTGDFTAGTGLTLSGDVVSLNTPVTITDGGPEPGRRGQRWRISAARQSPGISVERPRRRSWRRSRAASSARRLAAPSSPTRAPTRAGTRTPRRRSARRSQRRRTRAAGTWRSGTGGADAYIGVYSYSEGTFTRQYGSPDQTGTPYNYPNTLAVGSYLSAIPADTATSGLYAGVLIGTQDSAGMGPVYSLGIIDAGLGQITNLSSPAAPPQMLNYGSAQIALPSSFALTACAAPGVVSGAYTWWAVS